MKNKSFCRDFETEGQTFSPFEKQYFLNKDGVLEENPIMLNKQELIESSEYTSLDRIYDMYLETGAVGLQHKFSLDNDIVIEREGFEDDLSRMLAVDEIRDRYALENPEVANMSHKEMFDYINNKLKNANTKIGIANGTITPDVNLNEGDIKDASQNEQKSK